MAEFKKTLTSVEQALGVAAVDLCLPDLKFVYGEADPRKGVAIISIARLRPEFYGLPPDEKLFHQRIVKETAHELGHTYHLGHCPDQTCVMHFSGNLQESDWKGETFCSRCAPTGCHSTRTSSIVRFNMPHQLLCINKRTRIICRPSLCPYFAQHRQTCINFLQPQAT